MNTEEYVIVTLINNIDVVGVLGLESDNTLLIEDPMTFKQEGLIPDQNPLILMQRYIPYSKEKYIELNKNNVLVITHATDCVIDLYKFYVNYYNVLGDNCIENDFRYSLKFAKNTLAKPSTITINSKPINKLLL